MISELILQRHYLTIPRFCNTLSPARIDMEAPSHPMAS